MGIWLGRQERSPETRSGQTSPVPCARRAAPSHGRCLHAAALALHRRCACDIPPHPPGHTPQDHPRACVLADVRAQVRSTQQPQEARLERPSSPPGPPRPSRPIARSSEEGAAEGRRGTPAPPHHPRAHVRAHHTAAGSPPRATELALSEQARLVRAGPSRELRGIAPGGTEGGEERRHFTSIHSIFPLRIIS